MEGYRLAANYCSNYDPRYGNSLNGPSRRRIEEIIDFIDHVEAREKVSVLNVVGRKGEHTQSQFL
jgi:hypothetical protein